MSALDVDELLDVAGRLANGPTEADLRRSVSTAYYALFHLLVGDAAALMGGTDPEVRALVARALHHGQMQAVCEAFKSKSLPEVTKKHFPALPTSIPPELVDVALVFVDLQKLRHDADYATHALIWNTSDSQAKVRDARAAALTGRTLATDGAKRQVREVFLVSLALSGTFNQRG